MDVMKTITIDCRLCVASPGSCEDCVVGVILGAGPLSMNEDEQAAVAALATSRLVPPLRLLMADDPREARVA